jgi:hypothetical protein
VNTNLMHEVLAESQAGKLIFPKLVRRLLEAGVESYFCDLATSWTAARYATASPWRWRANSFTTAQSNMPSDFRVFGAAFDSSILRFRFLGLL